jgi:hypothetical protein
MDVLDMIGKVLPQFLQIDEIAPQINLKAKYLTLFYREILDFHIALLKVCRHAGEF